MNEYLKIIKEVESIKNNLIKLNCVYDDVSLPFILIKDIPQIQLEKSNHSNKSNDDLDMLLKLRNVLSKAYVVDTKQNKEVIFQTKKEKLIQNDGSVSTSVITMKPPKSTIIIKKPPTSKTNAKKPTFVPAHVKAPFKTDHNLHKPKSRSTSCHKESCIKSRSSSSDNGNILTKCQGPTMKDLKEQEKSSIKKLNEDHLIKTERDELRDVPSLFNELKEEIKKLEISPITIKDTEKKIVMKTVFEAGSDVKIPSDMKRECNTRLRLLSTLDNVFLKNMKPETQSSGCKSRRQFVDYLKVGNLKAERSHRLAMLELVLENIRGHCEFLDFVSCSLSQLAFTRACLSWALSEYVYVESIKSSSESCPSSLIIHDWLDKKVKTDPVDMLFCDRMFKTASLTSCSFISLSTSYNGSHPCVSLTVNRPKKYPFQFSFNNSKFPFPNMFERQSLQLLSQLQTKLYWSSLLNTWTRVLQERSQKNENPCSFYRQLYGLLLNKYPVILRDDC